MILIAKFPNKFLVTINIRLRTRTKFLISFKMGCVHDFTSQHNNNDFDLFKQSTTNGNSANQVKVNQVSYYRCSVCILSICFISDGGGSSSPHYESQDPSLDRLEPCGERLDSKGERLAQDEGRLHKERLGGSLDRL